MVEEGTQAPDFELPADDGGTVRLSALRGRPVVLYFYPKDDTPGCTTQACEFRDAWDAFRELGVHVLGVSPDDEASHRRFKEKHALPFTLLADVDHAVAEAYGVWGERTAYGKTFFGITRSTFVIDEEGIVVEAARGVKPEGHAQLVLDALGKRG